MTDTIYLGTGILIHRAQGPIAEALASFAANDGATVYSTTEQVTPEGYKAAMVARILDRFRGPSEAAPVGTDSFLDWLDGD